MSQSPYQCSLRRVTGCQSALPSADVSLNTMMAATDDEGAGKLTRLTGVGACTARIKHRAQRLEEAARLARALACMHPASCVRLCTILPQCPVCICKVSLLCSTGSRGFATGTCCSVPRALQVDIPADDDLSTAFPAFQALAPHSSFVW